MLLVQAIRFFYQEQFGAPEIIALDIFWISRVAP